jgi:fructose-1,6-bisphosphatase
MKSWEFVQARRGTTLSTFLRGIATVDDALEKFKLRKIIPPAIELIEEELQENKKELQPKKKEYDDIIIINTEERIVDD